MRLIDRLGRLPLVIVFGWAVAAALAVMVGVVGIGLVGSGLFAQRTEPLSEADVVRALETEETSTGMGDSPTPAPSETEQAPETHSVSTRGGTVVADCRRIISMSPAQGFALHDRDDDEGEFRSVRDNHLRVRVDLADCVNGVPHLEVTVETDDD